VAITTWQNRRLLHPAHQFQKFRLARRRQRRFRFVEDEDALPLAALLEEAHKSSLLNGFKLIWVVQSPCQKYFA